MFYGWTNGQRNKYYGYLVTIKKIKWEEERYNKQKSKNLCALVLICASYDLITWCMRGIESTWKISHEA